MTSVDQERITPSNLSLIQQAIFNNNSLMVKELVEYASKNGIIIDLNNNIKNNNYYPKSIFQYTIENANYDIFKYLLNYAETVKFIIDINGNNFQILYTIIYKLNVSMMKDLLDYANKLGIILSSNGIYNSILKIIQQNKRASIENVQKMK